MRNNSKVSQDVGHKMVTPEELADSRERLAVLLGSCGAGRLATNDAQPMLIFQRQGCGLLQTGKSVVRGPLCLAGKVFRFGLGTHGESDLTFRLPAGGRRLTGLCGINDSDRTRGRTSPQVFSVEAGGKEIWNSGALRVESEPARLEVDLGGQQDFTLKVRGEERRAHVDWVDLQVSMVNGKRVNICDFGSPMGEVFSFRYGGRESREFLSGWHLKLEQLPKKDGVVLRRIIRTDPETGLSVRVEVKEYTRFPVLEWVMHLKNTGKKETLLVEDLRSLDVLVCGGNYPYLNYWNGDYLAPDGYEPFRVSLAHGEEYRFAPTGGRGTDQVWPYYNIEWPDENRGLIAVVGWPGQWASRFRSEGSGTVHISAGQEITRFKLMPGEEARTPLSVLMFYRGDKDRSQNLWRHWMFAHNLPRPSGRLPQPLAAGYWGSEMNLADEESQLSSFNRFIKEKITPDVWWMDAGWYPCVGTWEPTGTWEVDRARFPRGLKEISDQVHKKGVKSLVWFEPERVRAGTWLHQKHPEWLLRAADKDAPVAAEENFLLDLGNPAAWKWLVAHYSRLIFEEGIDIYRQDCNFELLPYWRRNDGPERQGITENKHVMGYLSFWQELLRRFPNLLIDSCASGGRRNDLETMRLSVPLHKTDYKYDDQAVKQAFHHTLHQWLPYFAALNWPAAQMDAYAVRSSFAPGILNGAGIKRPELAYPVLRKHMAEWHALKHFFSADYYPLTPYSREETRWIAWQFHRPEEDEGLVQVFRRKDCPDERRGFTLRGLQRAAQYEVRELGSARKPVRLSGERLMGTGLPVTMKTMPGALNFIYRKVK